jgi:hypothetical protein
MEFRVLWLDTFVDPNMGWTERAWVPGRRQPWFGRVPVLGARCTEDTAAKLRDKMIAAMPELAGTIPFALSQALHYPEGWRMNVTYGSHWDAIQALAANMYIRAYADAPYGEDADPQAQLAKRSLPRQLLLRVTELELERLKQARPVVTKYTFGHSIEAWPLQAPSRAA